MEQLHVVKARSARLRVAASEYIKRNWMDLKIDELVECLENQSSLPLSPAKQFVADLAFMATRVWEIYSVDESGFLMYNIFQHLWSGI